MAEWFKAEMIEEDLYLIIEEPVIPELRSNMWLIKGPEKDILIDTGLGLSNMSEYLEKQGLIRKEDTGRPCTVICTHVHFDHTGGAHHFDDVYIHKLDLLGLQSGAQLETLNYVKAHYYTRPPYPGYSPLCYRVPPTKCQPLEDGDQIDLGYGHHLQVFHVPGHTKGSIMLYYPQKGYLFTGDFAYQCKHGTELFDWLPHSSIPQYVSSCHRVLEWLEQPDIHIHNVYGGHREIITKDRLSSLLTEYIEGRENPSCQVSCTTCCIKAVICCLATTGCCRCIPCCL